MKRGVTIPDGLRKAARIVDRDAFISDFGDPQVCKLFQHWDDVRGSRRMPSRRDIDAVELGTLLPSIILVDCSDPARPRIRIAGGDIEDRHRTSLRDKSYADFLPAEETGRMMMFTELICSQLVAVHGRAELARPNLPPVKGERLALPLSGDDASVTDFVSLAISNYHTTGRGERVDIGQRLQANVWPV